MQAGDKYRGKAYRTETNLLVTGKTAQDVIDFEANELGNLDIKQQTKNLKLDLKRISARQIVWVTTSKEQAQRYGDIVEEIKIPRNSIILACDGEDGYLVYMKRITQKESDWRYYQKNRKRIIARNRQYYLDNNEKVSKRKKEWYKNKQDKTLSHLGL